MASIADWGGERITQMEEKWWIFVVESATRQASEVASEVCPFVRSLGKRGQEFRFLGMVPYAVTCVRYLWEAQVLVQPIPIHDTSPIYQKQAEMTCKSGQPRFRWTNNSLKYPTNNSFAQHRLGNHPDFWQKSEFFQEFWFRAHITFGARCLALSPWQRPAAVCGRRACGRC
jgi:hypothetical protein